MNNPPVILTHRSSETDTNQVDLTARLASSRAQASPDRWPASEQAPALWPEGLLLSETMQGTS